MIKSEIVELEQSLPPGNQQLRPYLEDIGVSVIEIKSEFALKFGNSLSDVKLSRAELAGVLAACDRIYRSESHDTSTKHELILGVLKSVFATNNSQGENWSSCKAAAILTKLAIEDPARFSRIAADLIIDGKTPEGLQTVIPLSKFLRSESNGNLTQERTLLQSVMQASLMDAMNNDWTVALDERGRLISVRVNQTADSLPDKFAGGLDSWTEKGYEIIFGKGQIRYIDDKVSTKQSLINGEFNLQACSIKLSEYENHALLIERVVHDGNGYRIIFRDSMFDDSIGEFEKGPGRFFHSAKPEGGSLWSMSLDEALEGALNWVVSKDNFREDRLDLGSGDRSYQTFLKYLENSHVDVPSITPAAIDLMLVAIIADSERELRKKAQEHLFYSSKP